MCSYCVGSLQDFREKESETGGGEGTGVLTLEKLEREIARCFRMPVGLICALISFETR